MGPGRDQRRDEHGQQKVRTALLESFVFPGLEELEGLTAGRTVALTGVNATLAAAIACMVSRGGKRTLLVMDNDLKAARAADDIRHTAVSHGWRIQTSFLHRVENR